MRSSGTRWPSSSIGPTCSAELRAFRDGGPEHVAGRDVRHAVACGDPLCLGSLSGPLWAEDEYSHRCLAGYLRKPSYDRIIICDSIWRIVSSATPTAMSTEVPPSAPALACENPPYAMKRLGRTATSAR